MVDTKWLGKEGECFRNETYKKGEVMYSACWTGGVVRVERGGYELYTRLNCMSLVVNCAVQEAFKRYHLLPSTKAPTGSFISDIYNDTEILKRVFLVGDWQEILFKKISL